MKVLANFVAGLLALVVSQLSAAPSPYESVQTSTEQLLEKLVEVQPIYKRDKDKFFREVDSSLAPFIDFKGFSRGVMAKYYRRASDQQKARFAEVFRNSLIKTYAKALVEFDNPQVIVKQDNKPQKDPRKARVSLEVYGKDGSAYPVEYSLVLVNDRWKLRNLVIDGINIGLQFRSQFTAYMQQYKNDIDKVIDNWSVDA
ncbi:MAG: ABC transporter substrate-binding protein [Gammaproteobacteria bacterium]|nr:ABC transporter substrate-binding protein [Gammaproteobacteria bacterium]